MGRGGWDADYNDEARKLFARLQQRDTHHRIPQDANVVYEHPSGAKFFIGNESIASNKDELLRRGIMKIVNCQEPTARNFHQADERFEYLRFPIAFWKQFPETANPEGLLRFMEQGLFQWVDRHLHEGHNVMVHCLAGAHRAGTSGVSYVMHAKGLDFPTALREVQEQRDIVDPIFDFKTLLEMLDYALAARRGGARQADDARQGHPLDARSAHQPDAQYGHRVTRRTGPAQHPQSLLGDAAPSAAARRPVGRDSRTTSAPLTAARRLPPTAFPAGGRLIGRSPAPPRTFRV
mmetsp:Transcript_114479/g.334694  ORF Transcript_114479/g.334694 Transcript_114479/m.334694 type:complete len:292 (+) Transcript_114479:47-922(+)